MDMRISGRKRLTVNDFYLLNTEWSVRSRYE